MFSAHVLVAGLLATGGLMVAPAEASEPHGPDPSAAAGELQEILRAEHPETFAGLWLDGEDIAVAAVSGDPAVLATAEEAYAGPAQLRAVPAEYSEAELEQAMGELNAVFGQLAEEQSVHTLGVRLPRNRVVLEAARPEEVDLSPYVSGDVAQMVVVEGGEAPTTLESEDGAAAQSRAPTAVLLSGAALLVLLAGGLWYVRRRRPVG